MKKLLAIIAVLLMIFSMTACGGKESAPEESAADDTAAAEEAQADEEETEQQTGIANPWSEAATLEEAVEGAGIDGFTFVDGMVLTLGEVNAETYRYMDGIVDIEAPVAAVEMTIRKGRSSLEAESGDISGDYNKYTYEWTQNVKGLEVKCFGNREGEATKTIWTVDDYSYAILAYGAGGDDDFGLNADDINSLVNGIQ